MLHEGTGRAVAKGDLIAIDYVGEIWKTGKVFDTSFDGTQTPAAFTIGTGQVIDGFDQGLTGRKVGSRVLLVIPPAQAYGSQGNSAAGIAAHRHVVFVVDLLGAHTQGRGRDRCPGGTDAGRPAHGQHRQGPADHHDPAGQAARRRSRPPSSCRAPATSSSPVTSWSSSTWASSGPTARRSTRPGTAASPAGFPIGVGQVIKGWDTGLVGKHVGDRVLLVVPPADGYGAQGQSQAGITGTDTLVFAVDIVATYH